MPVRGFKARPNLVYEGHSNTELLESFLKLVQDRLAANTYKKYHAVLKGPMQGRQTFIEYLEANQLTLHPEQKNRVKSEHVDDWLKQWQKNKAAKHQYAITVQRFLNFLGLIDPKNGLQVDVPQRVKNRLEEVRRQIISQEELEAFLSACGHDHVAALIGAMLWETGIRVSELVAIQWEHIDIENRRIRLPIRKGGGRDTVPFGIYTVNYLRLLAASGKQPTEPVFPSRSHYQKGNALTTDGVRHIIQRVADPLGWREEQMHPHAFRHSFSTEYIRRGGNPVHLKELLGHSDIKTTMIYTHLAESAPIEEHHALFSPDWKPIAEEAPLEPKKCPKCSLIRLPGQKQCQACGYDFTGEYEQKLREGIETQLREELKHQFAEQQSQIEEFIKTHNEYWQPQIERLHRHDAAYQEFQRELSELPIEEVPQWLYDKFSEPAMVRQTGIQRALIEFLQNPTEEFLQLVEYHGKAFEKELQTLLKTAQMKEKKKGKSL